MVEKARAWLEQERCLGEISMQVLLVPAPQLVDCSFSFFVFFFLLVCVCACVCARVRARVVQEKTQASGAERVTEVTQSSRTVEVRRDLLRLVSPSQLLKQDQLELVGGDVVQSGVSISKDDNSTASRGHPFHSLASLTLKQWVLVLRWMSAAIAGLRHNFISLRDQLQCLATNARVRRNKQGGMGIFSPGSAL